MAYLEKLTINGTSYDLADAQLREAQEEMKTAGEKLAEEVSLLQTAQGNLEDADTRLAESISQLQTAQTEMQAADERQQEAISLLQETLDAMKITDTAAGESLYLPDSLAGKLLGLKAYVSASQAGEGEPSATNIRPISPAAAGVTVQIADNGDMTGAASYEAALPENMYGGYFDWGRGVFVQTHGYAVVDGNTGTVFSNGANKYYISGALDSKKPSQYSSGDLQHTGLCDSIHYLTGSNQRSVFCSGVNVWFNGITDCATPEEMKAFLQENPATVVYPLATPVEHILENAPALAAEALYPQTYITTTGSKVEATYEAGLKAYIDKKFKEAANENL